MTPSANPAPGPEPVPPRLRLSAREQYHIVSDNLVGVNLRRRDNLIQAVVIAVFTAVGSVLGWTGVLGEWALLDPALVGALAGLIVGTLVSGAFLMVYRGVRHLRGRHD